MVSRTPRDSAPERVRTCALAVLCVLLAGPLTSCSDYRITSVGQDDEGSSLPWDDEDDSDGSDDSDSSDDGQGNDPVDDGSDEEEDITDDDDDGTETPEPGETADNPRPLLPGDLVINELMIDPVEVSDADGEYVELRNNGGAWVEFQGLRLGDWDVDDTPVEPLQHGPILLGPGAFYVICVFDDFWDNGGVDCDATVEYSTWGGGFALSNTEDEVILSSSSGVDLDIVIYDISLVEPGEATGVDPDYSSVNGNNDLDEWCTQFGVLPFGDSGSPGESNDNCW